MARPGSTFPVRFRSQRLRALLREIAAREGMSQNDLVEQAVEHEVVARGALLAEDLAAASRRLWSLTAAQHEALVDQSAADFARGEGGADPIRARRVRLQPLASSAAAGDSLDAVAAFRAARP